MNNSKFTRLFLAATLVAQGASSVFCASTFEGENSEAPPPANAIISPAGMDHLDMPDDIGAEITNAAPSAETPEDDHLQQPSAADNGDSPVKNSQEWRLVRHTTILGKTIPPNGAKLMKRLVENFQELAKNGFQGIQWQKNDFPFPREVPTAGVFLQSRQEREKINDPKLTQYWAVVPAWALVPDGKAATQSQPLRFIIRRTGPDAAWSQFLTLETTPDQDGSSAQATPPAKTALNDSPTLKGILDSNTVNYDGDIAKTPVNSKENALPARLFGKLKWLVMEINSNGRVIRGLEIEAQLKQIDSSYSAENIHAAVVSLQKEGILSSAGLAFSVEEFEDAYFAATPRLFGELPAQREKFADKKGTLSRVAMARLQLRIMEIASAGDAIRVLAIVGKLRKIDAAYSDQNIRAALLALHEEGILVVSDVMLSQEDFETAFIAAAPKLFRDIIERRKKLY
jgi:hypothetical protein